MDKQTAVHQIRDACNQVARELMRIHPAARALDHKAAQDEIYKAIFELTRQLETIKKQLAKLESGDPTPEL